jgi:GT2 family glycosyltransferase
MCIILVDNGSSDMSGERLKNEFPNLVAILLNQNTGYAGGNNVGIRYALEHGAEYVLVINNDVVVDKGFLNPMVEVAENRPEVGIVLCTVFFQSSPYEIFSAAGKMNLWLCTGVNKGHYINYFHDQDKACFTDYACGVLMLMRKNMLVTKGLLNERYFMYFEDVEYSRRISSKYKIAYTPLGRAYHKSGGGKGWRNYTELYLYYHTRNRLWTFQNDPVVYYIYVIIFTLFNSIMKSCFIMTNIVNDKSKCRSQLIALWRGLKDGIINQMPGHS